MNVIAAVVLCLPFALIYREMGLPRSGTHRRPARRCFKSVGLEA
jgi:hypothetical protein